MFELNKIYHGNAPDIMKGFPKESINCCVTSPPYWGLRDYGTDPVSWPEVSFSPMPGLPEMIMPAETCSLGLEKDPWSFVGHMVLIFRCVRRILKKDGTLWLNLGDSYAGGGMGDGGLKCKQKTNKGSCGFAPRKPPTGLKAKDLIGIPWRVAFALQADGWYLRQDIIWAKPNPMPESVTDRCTKSHEYIFLLSKSARYLYDCEAIKEPVGDKGNANSFRGGCYVNGNTDNATMGKRTVSGNTKIKVPAGWDISKGSGSHGNYHKDGRGGSAYSFARKTTTIGKPGEPNQHREDREDIEYCGSRNKRSVWTVATYPYKKAHFATFPPKLITPCILAGCPKGGSVIDIFCGSGTVPFVCRENNRDWVGIDLSKTYIEEIATQRIKNAEPQLF